MVQEKIIKLQQDAVMEQGFCPLSGRDFTIEDIDNGNIRHFMHPRIPTSSGLHNPYCFKDIYHELFYDILCEKGPRPDPENVKNGAYFLRYMDDGEFTSYVLQVGDDEEINGYL